MAIDSIGKKFVHDLAEIYDAEHHFLAAQQKMTDHATSPLLQSMLSEHMLQTRMQIGNLERIYTMIGSAPIRGHCSAAVGLVEEGDLAIAETDGKPDLVDCVIATAAARVEHYEVAVYRNLIATAEYFEQPAVLDLLRQNLLQEEQTAQKVEQGYMSLISLVIGNQKLERLVGL